MKKLILSSIVIDDGPDSCDPPRRFARFAAERAVAFWKAYGMRR